MIIKQLIKIKQKYTMALDGHNMELCEQKMYQKMSTTFPQLLRQGNELIIIQTPNESNRKNGIKTTYITKNAESIMLHNKVF